MRRLLVLAVLAASALPAAEWSDDFDARNKDWLLPLPHDWALVEEGEGKALSLEKARPVGNPRRPVKFAVFKPACVGDFELTVRVKRREKSLIVVFGYQNRSRFYYAHISRDDGNHSVHNGIFKVYGGSRYRIGGSGSAPVLPDTDWHRIRLVRQVATGKIELWVDDDAKPRFEVLDRSFGFGRVGLGSFDETGEFDDFHLSGDQVEGCQSRDLSPLDPS